MPSYSEFDVSAAVRAVREKQMSLRAAEKKFHVPRSTIEGRIGGAKPRPESHAFEQKLSIEQERELCDWIKDLDKRHQAPSHARIRRVANLVLRLPVSDESLGQGWIQQFLKRHPDIATLNGDPHESARVNQATENIVRDWFELYYTEKAKYRISDENIHNMDEHGLCIGKINPRKVIGQAYTNWGQLRKRTRIRNSQKREWVSIIECISGNLTSPQPLIIFAGKSIQLNWVPNEVPPYKYTYSEKAWSNSDICLWWLNEIFIPQTRPQGSAYRMLLFDNHETHLTDEFLHNCRRQRIIVLPLPPHTSDVLQPLDLIMFSPIKGKYKDKLYELAQLNDGSETKKKEFLYLYHQARIETFHQENIKSAFKTAGLIPFNPEKVVQKDAVLKTPKTPPPVTRESSIETPHGPQDIEKALHAISSNPNWNTPTRYAKTTKLCRKTMKTWASDVHKISQQHLELESKQYKVDEFLQTKPRQSIQPKKGRHLVDNEDAEKAVKKWKQNTELDPQQGRRLRDRMKA